MYSEFEDKENNNLSKRINKGYNLQYIEELDDDGLLSLDKNILYYTNIAEIKLLAKKLNVLKSNTGKNRRTLLDIVLFELERLKDIKSYKGYSIDELKKKNIEELYQLSKVKIEATRIDVLKYLAEVLNISLDGKETPYILYQSILQEVGANNQFNIKSDSNVAILRETSIERKILSLDVLYSKLRQQKFDIEKLEKESGFCIINKYGYFSKIYDSNMQTLPTVLPNYLVQEKQIQKGDFVVYWKAKYKNCEFVYRIDSINICRELGLVEPSLKLELIPKILDYSIVHGKESNTVVVWPFASEFEFRSLQNANVRVQYISAGVDVDDIRVFCDLCVPILQQECANDAKKITVIANLDKLGILFESLSVGSKLSRVVSYFINTAIVYANGGQLSVICCTQDSKLYNLLLPGLG
ncbi:MAG: hypothetical protein FWF56_01110 [Firmicutes bacterium]|nr:hypothetical protein [Bacillota bacterium]MCL1954056.1 hypothetical protein [Bacillota bacterium]